MRRHRGPLICLWLITAWMVAQPAGPGLSQVIAAEPGKGAAERTQETARRRARLMERAGGGMVVLISGEPKNVSNDVDYPFRQENNLYYLTGLNQAGITLIMLPDNRSQREILFLPRREPAREVWTGRMLSQEEARRLSGIEQIWESEELEPFLNAVLTGNRYEKRPSSSSKDYETIFRTAAQDSTDLWLILAYGSTSAPLFQRERAFSDTLAARYPRIRRKDLLPVFRDLRIVKSAYEIDRLQSAIDITCEAHQGVMKMVQPGMNESELDGFIYATYRKHGAQWGFPSIVGSGPNATTLHYEENARQIGAGELVVIDIGAAVDHYSADVTRTVPAGGRFTPDQRVIYEIVLRAQEASMAAARPGATIREIHNTTLAVIKKELLRIGLVADTTGNQYRMWFMHGTSHWLGLDVHDVGTRDTVFQPGMVLSVEPGLYIRADALDYLDKTPENAALIEAIRPAFERYKNIGVRIEDDVLVTEDGCELLSAAAPRTVEAIETLMNMRP